MLWDPDQYGIFSGPRSRPALDLMRSFDHPDPRTVVDLGCGTGHLTAVFPERWPSAHVIGIDQSSTMLARVDAGQTSITWLKADIGKWEPDRPVDVIFSNAALHWLDDHSSLFPRLAGFLAPGGVLAVQIPANHAEPSHQVAYDLAGGTQWGPRLGAIARPSPVLDMVEYARLLEPLLAELDVWRTTYLHILTGEHAVSRWVEGSSLRPFLDALDEAESVAFLTDYRTAIHPAYPTLPDGRTLFPFTRLFIVGRTAGHDRLRRDPSVPGSDRRRTIPWDET